MISNLSKNIMGTVSFDGKFTGMRKAQDFIVYPMQDSGERISIQSDNRFGQIDLATGNGVLSTSHSYANWIWLSNCIVHRTAIAIALTAEDTQTLRQWIKSTGGLEVGSSIVKSDNTGAMAL